MATKYECDRCGYQSSGRHEMGTIELPLTDYYGAPQEDTYKKDLCSSCLKTLTDFLKPLPKKVRA